MDSESKQRVSLYLDKQTVKTIDMFIEKHGLHSRNEFFERAAENLIADEVNLSIILDTFNSNKIKQLPISHENTVSA